MLIEKKEKSGIIKEEGEVFGGKIEIYFSQEEMDAFILEYDEGDENTPTASSSREIARKIIAALKVINES